MNIPPILQQLQGASSLGNLGQIKQMMSMVRSAGNPQAMLMQMMQNSPQMGQVMQLVNQSGGDPKKAFYDVCQQKGVDPNEILGMLR